MHPFFAPLQEQELALLLTTLTVGSSEQASLFSLLPQPQRDALNDKARALLAIAADKRVPLMVRELKDALGRNGRRGVERMDPSWIVHGLRGEGPQVVAIILLGLPAPLMRSVLRRLPPAIRSALPAKAVCRALPQALVDLVRITFESRFAPMPERSPGPFSFSDIIHLERPELFVLIRDQGLIELGQAFVSVGKMALLELCRRLPREHADELVLAVKTASKVDAPDVKNAQRFLSRVVVNFENTEELLQKAGLWRLAKACPSESDAFVPVLLQRLPRRAAQHLRSFFDKAQAFAEVTPEARTRLQDQLLVRVLQLSKNGTLGAQWESVQMHYHDPQAASEALHPAMPQALSGEASRDMLEAGALSDDNDDKPPQA